MLPQIIQELPTMVSVHQTATLSVKGKTQGNIPYSRDMGVSACMGHPKYPTFFLGKAEQSKDDPICFFWVQIDTPGLTPQVFPLCGLHRWQSILCLFQHSTNYKKPWEGALDSSLRKPLLLLWLYRQSGEIWALTLPRKWIFCLLIVTAAI